MHIFPPKTSQASTVQPGWPSVSPQFGFEAQGPPNPPRERGGLAVLGPALAAEALGGCGLWVICLLQAPTPGVSRGPRVEVALLTELLPA